MVHLRVRWGPGAGVTQVPGGCRPGTVAGSGKRQAGAGATVSSMNRVRTANFAS